MSCASACSCGRIPLYGHVYIHQICIYKMYQTSITTTMHHTSSCLRKNASRLHTFAKLKCKVKLPKEAWHARRELRQKKKYIYICGTNGLKTIEYVYTEWIKKDYIYTYTHVHIYKNIYMYTYIYINCSHIVISYSWRARSRDQGFIK